MDQDNQNQTNTSIGADAWVGNSVSAPKNNPKVPLSSDLPPLSGKSVTSVPEEHRFDRVPPPLKNPNPEPTFPKPGEALDNAMKRMADQNRNNSGPVPEAPTFPPSSASGPEVRPDQRVRVSSPEGSGMGKEAVLEQVKSGIPAALYDSSVIPLIENGMAKLEFGPAKDGIKEIVAVSTKDNQPLRVVGYAKA